VVDTLDYSLAQLNRMQDRVESGLYCRIIHLIINDNLNLWNDHRFQEDRYRVVIDCDPKTYLVQGLRSLSTRI